MTASPEADERADGERVGGQERDPRLEAGRPAGAGHQPVAGRCGPEVVGQVGEVDDAPAGEPVAGWEHGDHRLLHELVPAQPGVLAPRRRGVLEAQREMQATRPHPGGEVVEPALLDRDAQLRMRAQERDHRRGDDRRQRAREGADAQLAPLARHAVRQLPVREPEPLGDDVGVREQLLARGRDLQLAAPALQQAGAGLPLERGDLLRDRRLRERQRLARAGERPVQRDFAEGQHAARVEH